MSNKIHVRLKDQSGTHFIFSQGISINRTQIVEVENDQTVAQALLHGALVKATPDEIKAHKEKVEAEKEPVIKATAETKSEIELEKAKTEAEALLKTAEEKKVAIVNDKGYLVLKKQFASKEEALDLVLKNEKFKDGLTKATSETK